AVAAGAPLPPGADVVVPPAWTDQDTAAVEIRWRPRRGHGVRRAGDEIKAGASLTAPGTPLTPAMIAVLAATGVTRVAVRPQPRVALIATGDELVEPGVASQPGHLVDVNSHALAAAAVEAGASPYRAGICADNQDALRTLVAEQAGKADLIVTSGGSGTGPGDLVRRALGADGGVRFTEVSLFPCSVVGFGLLPGCPPAEPRTGGGRTARVPVLCLPGDPGSALIGFEVLGRPMIQKLAGAEPFRRSARAHLLDTLLSPLGRREFRPAQVAERRGGGYTARPLSGGPYTLSGMALANGLIVLGERVGRAPAGSTVDVLLLDRRR
ncbi:MAG TPA: gephyrin-like molybdotransferase Glp, partial [Micromonosporaceae bacterium]